MKKNQDQHARAAELSEQAPEEEPKIPQARLLPVTCYTVLGRTEDAIAGCQRTLAMDSRNNHVYALSAEAYINDANPAEIQPKLTRTLLTPAACLVGTKPYGRAEPMLKDIIREFPKLQSSRFNARSQLI
jgi:tetratricopeptide (TPR) repeat protein